MYIAPIRIFIAIAFLLNSLAPAYSQVNLPEPGSRVDLSPAFQPALIRGLKVHPDDPFMFDFIVDPGDDRSSPDDLKVTSQRMINYFLASLATPEKDLWVNLSPVEKDHIIPDSLNRTELGRDLLAEDYMLKQIGASLIYPESGLGKAFWNRVYDEAYRKFGVTQVPVNMFNKIWILPEKATVFEKGNTVYIVNAHLKVMLEEDLLARKMLGKKVNDGAGKAPVMEISKQILREIVVPAIEKEVNEGRNFAQLRQVFYALVLAQWYQDAFKGSILNRDYSGQKKMAGIDVSDPKNKELIYRRYLAAYKKGVFNYIKEETSELTQQPVPRKYFSGGFVDQPIQRSKASDDDLAMAAASSRKDLEVEVHLDPAMTVEPRENWNNLNRALGILDELKALFKTDGTFNSRGFDAFINKYSEQVASQRLYPVQSAWPVLKAITLLDKSQEDVLIAALKKKYSNADRPELVDKIFLMNNIIDRGKWLEERAPYLLGRRIYLLAAEIHHWAGGLGPVMKFHGKGMKDLGADVVYVEPRYQYDINGRLLNYTDKNIGLKELNDAFDVFTVDVGDVNGKDMRHVRVIVSTGIDENGIRVYMFRDVNSDGGSFYTKMLYNYRNVGNPVSKEESMAFINVASAALIERLEKKRQQEQGDAWKPAVVHSNDGQYAPLQAVTMSRYGELNVIKDIFWAFTTHTYRNRGANGDSNWTVNVFLKHMMGIKNRFVNAFQQSGYYDYTSGGVRLSNWAGAVSDKHRDDMAYKDPYSTLVSVTNGAVPEEMAAFYRQEFKKLQQEGKISQDADFERPTALEDALVKRAAKMMINEGPAEDRIRTASGAYLQVDLDRPLIGYDRRLVIEKAGRERAFTDSNIWKLVGLGFNVVLMGNHQGTDESEDLAIKLVHLQADIAYRKKREPQGFPGSFQFVDSFTAAQKKIFLAAADIQIQDSDEHTGAAEFSEEDITANGGYQGGPTYREGVIVDQGIPVDFKNPGRGQTLVPKEDTPASWVDSVYVPLMSLWNKDPQHLEFYENAALSPRLNRIQRYLITSAAYLREYNRLIRKQEEDEEAQVQIVDRLGGDRDVISKILYNGHNEVKKFGFYVPGKRIEADSGGLKDFLNKKEELEEEYGYDVFLDHLHGKHFQNYLEALFSNTSSADLLVKWIRGLEDDTGIKPLEKQERFGRFVNGLVTKLDGQLQESSGDKAMLNPGGIKLDDIAIEHHGNLTASIVSDQALEGMLLKAQGLTGVIESITPIPDLVSFIQ